MKLSTKGRYGTRALLELALHDSDEPMILKDIAEKQDLSLSYLEHIITPLVTSGIVRSIKGPKGGISLVQKPSEIQLSEIIRILEGSISPTECIDNPDCCERADYCVTRDIWSELKDAMDGVLGSITLQDLVERHMKKKESVEEMYYI